MQTPGHRQAEVDTPFSAKGLELDVVVIVDPERIRARHSADLYGANSRATRRLGGCTSRGDPGTSDPGGRRELPGEQVGGDGAGEQRGDQQPPADREGATIGRRGDERLAGFYRRFATHLAMRGVDVVTVDYRGIVGSRHGPLRGVAADLSHWRIMNNVSRIQCKRRRFRSQRPRSEETPGSASKSEKIEKYI